MCEFYQETETVRKLQASLKYLYSYIIYIFRESVNNAMKNTKSKRSAHN